MIFSTRNHAKVKIVQSRKLSLPEIRSSVYDFRQKMIGKSNGPREVRKLINYQSYFGRVGELKANKIVDSIWVPGNEELLMRLLRSNISAQKLFIGPNVAAEKPKLSELILRNVNSRVLVPSESMKDILLDRKLGYLPENLLIWFAGVDHKYWHPDVNANKHFVLVYQKGPDSEDRVKLVVESLRSLNLQFVIIKYGEYRQGEYLRLLNECKFVIWVGHTETQGIAQFQAWAMNVPTLVSGLPKKRLEERDGFMASAAPYLSSSTGILARKEQPSLEEITLMNESLENLSPRLWIIDNATQEIAISNLVKIFNEQITN